jgi:hypothetical protein
MYDPRFIEKLFKPQEMYSISSTRQIFEGLANLSSWGLKESSMDKLFDLMAMGFKYQVISCVTPQEVIDVTYNHLDNLKRLVATADPVIQLLDECVRQMQVAYGRMSVADFNAMRQSLCTFFQDRKVKVSLFLHDQTQNSDGSIVVPSGGTLPPGTLPLGTIRYFSGGQETRREALPVITAGMWKMSSGLRTVLGAHVYEKDRAAPAEAPPSEAPPPSGPAPPPAPSPTDAAKAAAAVGELNLLASLIGTQTTSSAPTDNFKLENLFGNSMFGNEQGGGSSDVIVIGSTGPSAYRSTLAAVGQEMEVGGADPGAEPDDLLDLMDNAN